MSDKKQVSKNNKINFASTNFNKKTAMFVSAHPDDVDFYAGGLLANLASSEWKIRCLIFTSGEKGTMDLKMKSNQLIRIREKEQTESLSILGCKDLVFARLKCRDLAKDFKKAREILTQQIRKFRPQLLVSFDPWKAYELHPDHITCGHLTLEGRACARLPLYYPLQLGQGLYTVSVPTVMLFSPHEPNYHENISNSIEKKITAILTHKSQFGSREESTRKKIYDNAKADGKKAHMRYSEPYHKIQFP